MFSVGIKVTHPETKGVDILSSTVKINDVDIVEEYHITNNIM